MGELTLFCRHPGDPDGCSRSLIGAWWEDTLLQHCVIQGFAADWRQCGDVLLAAICPSLAPPELAPPAGDIPSEELRMAAEKAILVAYPLDECAPGVHPLFYRAYSRQATRVIQNRGISEQVKPALSDVLQEVMWAMHSRLLKRLSLTSGSLATYVRRVAFRVSTRMLKQRRRRREVPLPEDEDGSVTLVGASGPEGVVPLAVVEVWEDLDNQVAAKGAGDLLDRIIFAHHCLEGSQTGDVAAAREMRSCWMALANRPEADFCRLVGRVPEKLAGAPRTGKVLLAAELINHPGLFTAPAVFRRTQARSAA